MNIFPKFYPISFIPFRKHFSTVSIDSSAINASTSNPAKLYYTRHQAPRGNPKLNLLVVHGQLGSHKNFQSIVKFNKIAKYANSVVIDLRNHGSSQQMETMSLSEMAADLAHLINELQLNNLILMGHSLGGRVVMKCAVDYPHLMNGVIIGDILPIGYTNHHIKFEFPYHMQKLLNHLNKMDLKKNIDEIRKDIALVEKYEAGVNFIMTNLVEIAPNEYKWRCNMKTIAECYMKNTSEEIIARYDSKFTGKVKVIIGEKSPYVLQSLCPSYENIFDQYDVRRDTHVIKGAGHWIHADKPYEFIETVSEFLARF